jgi:hypothetical protein
MLSAKAQGDPRTGKERERERESKQLLLISGNPEASRNGGDRASVEYENMQGITKRQSVSSFSLLVKKRARLLKLVVKKKKES